MPKRKRRLKSGTVVRAQAKSKVSLAPFPLKGDHGPGTQAADENTIIVPIKDDPNGRGFRYRVNSVDVLESKLTLRQLQAAREIQVAYQRNEMLCSGSPLKEKVDGTPKPDATVAAQVEARGRLVRAMHAVRPSERSLVIAVCWNNQRLGQLRGESFQQALARFRVVMDRVADHLKY